MYKVELGFDDEEKGLREILFSTEEAAKDFAYTYIKRDSVIGATIYYINEDGSEVPVAWMK